MKKALLIGALIALVSTSMCFAASAPISVIINNNTVTWDDAKPFIDSNNRTLVPIRTVCEAYGCTAEWDNTSRQAVVTKENIIVRIPINENYILINGESSSLDSPACIVKDRTYLPLRAVIEAFGASVEWNQTTKTIIVTDNNKDIEEKISDVPVINESESNNNNTKSVVTKPQKETVTKEEKETEAESKYDKYLQYKDVIDKKIADIKSEGDVCYDTHSEFNRKLAEYQKEVFKYEQLSTQYSFDTSAQAQAKYAEYKALAEESKDKLGNYVDACKRASNIEALEAELESYYDSLFN